MPSSILVRPVKEVDFEAWLPLWDAYNAFYGRKDETALAIDTTNRMWRRLFDPAEPVYALVADSGSRLVGLAHYLFHRSTTSIEFICYLQDLFTAESERRCGIGTALIKGVYEAAKEAGVKQVYWQTHQSNTAARSLYDKIARHTGFSVYSHEL